MTASKTRSPIAIVGISALFPGSRDAAGFWNDIVAGRDRFTDVPPSHWLIEDYYDPDPAAPDKTYARRGAFLSPIPFDPLEHGIPPSVVPATDTSQLLALILAKQVLEEATRTQFREIDRERTSVILGLTSGQELLVEAASRLQRPVWVRALREHGLPEDEVQRVCDRIAGSYTPWQENTFPGLLGNVVAGRIANRLNLGGTNCVTDAACASTFSALQMGISELWLGDSDMVISGGVETFNDIFMFMCFSKTPALSRSGVCRPFDAEADGTMLGEGLGFVALRRLEDAERDGNRIYAVIRGIGSSSDGRAKSVYAPLADGQAKALRRAYAQAGYGPETVELVEAHGTGTKAGDVAEFQGLRTVFSESGREDPQWCALGTVKSQIGHTKAAAGAAGLIKSVLALHHGVLPPTIHVDAPHPGLEIETSPFYLNTRARPWIRDARHPRRASVSSFGFGGSNFHIALEEYGGSGTRADRLDAASSELVVLSAADPAALAKRADELRGALPTSSLAALARRSHAELEPGHAARLAVVATSIDDLGAKLGAALDHLGTAPDRPLSRPDGLEYAAAGVSGRVALLFPGQGSQYVEMGGALAMRFETARSAWDEAAGLDLGDAPLQRVVFPAPAFDDATREAQVARLTATEWAQPALGAASAALLRTLRALGVRGEMAAGHSFGELTALFAAGSFDLATFLRLARARGELMARASSTPGAMLAVSHAIEPLRKLIGPWHGTVVVANHNSPRQAVLSGPAVAIDEIAARLRDEGITARRLPVSTAFHSPLVAEAGPAFRKTLDTAAMEPPHFGVYSSADVRIYPESASAMRDVLAGQLTSPVRFAETIEAMHDAGARVFVEVGPGSVLTSLVGDILGERPHAAVAFDRKGRDGLAAFWHGLGRLLVAGVPLDLSRIWDGIAPFPEPKSSDRPTLDIGGANYAKPYPPPGGAAALPAPNPPRPTAVMPGPPSLASISAGGHASSPAPRLIPTPAPVTATTTAPRTTDAAWLAAWQEMQRQTAEAHTACQRSMAESHQAFLQANEAAFSALATWHAGAPPLRPADLAAEATRGFEDIVIPSGPPGPVASPPSFGAEGASEESSGSRRSFVATPTDAAPQDDRSATGINGLLLELVAEKTGYPANMLGVDMELEADLGIDSIKRVEILSALQERIPDLPAVAASEMGALRTLRQILERLGAAEDQKRSSGATPTDAAPHDDGSTSDISGLLLELVAEKTGYPANMLGLDMELEADLGIDSIKRVEILSALQERVPDLPAVAASETGALRTLRQILVRLGSAEEQERSSGATPSERASQDDGRAARPQHAPPDDGSALDISALLLELVAEKTGYPTSMLGLDMELEADLGIDSIKRVEILSALQERVPDLPAVAASEMGALRTLRLIAERLGSASPTTAPAVEASTPAAASTSVVGHAPEAVPARPTGLAMAGLFTSGPIAILDDGAGVAGALAATLTKRGAEARVVEQVPEGGRAVVVLAGLREMASTDEALAIQRAAFEAARSVAQALTREGGLFVTVQDTGGDFGLSGAAAERAWLGGLAGLVKTARYEWPLAGVKAIDIERGGRDAASVAAALADELFSGGPEHEVGLRADGRRVTIATHPAPATTPGPGFGERAFVLVSGGARGVTGSCLVELARRRSLRIGVLGRTPLGEEPAWARDLIDEAGLSRACIEATNSRPSLTEVRQQVRSVLAAREVRDTIEALRSAGAEVRYHSVDVRKPEQVGRVVAELRALWGPPSVLLHAAGVLADKLIAEKSPEQFDAVFGTKTRGLRALLDATHDDPLRFIGLFSSVAARTGNPGQSDYAMANETLNKVAAAEARRRGDGCVVRSWNWGPWDGGMVDDSLRRHFEQRGVGLIPVAEGSRRFADDVLGQPGPIEVVLGVDPSGSGLGIPSVHRVTLEVLVRAETHPWLASHRVREVPVVPVVLVAEWFARAAGACRPDLFLSALTEIRVLRGIALERFDAGGHAFRVECREVTNGSGARLAVELRAADGRLHYSAGAEMTERAPAGVAAPPTGDLATAAPWSPAEAYAQVLFHGPDFHVIQSLEALDAQGAQALLTGVRDARWSAGPWLLDAAALDGGLQLAILWGVKAIGKPTLPTQLGRLVLHAAEPASGLLRCALKPRSTAEQRTLCDLVFSDANGTLHAELLGLEMHAVPEARPAATEPAEDPTPLAR